MQKAVFLDRDGVINVDKAYVAKIEDFEFCEGVFEALKAFQARGYILVLVTNQSGIARGYYTEKDFQMLTAWMQSVLLEQGIVFQAIYHCPHAPEANCTCRKPRSGMLEHAIRDCHIDAARSWMVGDKESDIQAALGARITQTVLLAQEGTPTDAKYCVNALFDTIDFIK